MKTFASAIVALGLFAGAAQAKDIFTQINETAPRSVFQDLNETAPKSAEQTLKDINDSAPRSDGVFGDLETRAP
jgi:hypothetical protein